MKKWIFIALFIMTGCMSSPVLNNGSARNLGPSTQVYDIEFDDIDINQDGNISQSEIKVLREKVNSKTSKYETSTPMWTTIGIILLTLVMCITSALVRCNKSE